MAGVTGWRWSWSASDGTEAGHLGLALGVGTGLVHVTASLARPGRDLVLLDEPEAPAPRPPSREVRAAGLWADAIEEEPGRRWTIGLEAFALEVAAATDTVGHRVPLGFDLEWEAVGPGRGDGRVPARVHGEVLIGQEALDLDADGWWVSLGATRGAGTGHH